MRSLMNWGCAISLILLADGALADDVGGCYTRTNADERLKCLENKITALKNQIEGNIFQSGSQTFGQSQPNSSGWTLQLPPLQGGTSWTSAPIRFPHQYARKPAVYVAIGGVDFGANIAIDRAAYSIEVVEINETGFRITIRRTQGLLYELTVNWIAYAPKRS
jgi:H-type lectin domain